MGLVVLCSDMIASKVCVYLRCSDAGVTQKLLDVPQRSASLQQVRGEAMPQRMRRNFPVYSRALRMAFEYEPEALARLLAD